ncbi:MAG: hypothetical protein IRZ33_08530 [Alicyclobacillaceae bacterium]|nr:hypothetical protein [Alicyclobacillaceae bacterium]
MADAWEELSERLAKARADLLERDRLRSQLERCREVLRREEELNSELRAQLTEEERTLAQEEGFSVQHLLHRLLGTHEDRVDEAKKQLVQIRMKLAWSNQALSRLRQEEEQLTERLRSLAGVDSLYEQLLADKEHRIRTLGGETGLRLADLAERQAQAQAQHKEVAEALQAAQEAMLALRTAAESLQKARNWGTVDLLGGGLITTAIKRSHMDDANAAAARAQNALNRLERELRDVRIPFQASLSSGGFLTFADYFLDGLVSDWLVQREIRDALAAVEHHQELVNQVVARLQAADQQLVRELETLAEERRRILEDTQD